MNQTNKAGTPMKSQRVQGESFVWLTSMGLAAALAMVATLLILIISQGIGVFWPKDVTRLVMSNNEIVIGKMVASRTKSNDQEATETLLFIGNKSGGSQAFRYIEDKDVKEATTPESIIELERTENGNAIGYPVKLVIKGGEPVPATDANFNSTLRKLVSEIGDRRDAIKALEKGKIGFNSLEIKRRELKIKEAQPDEVKRYEQEIAQLRAEYQKLNTEAKELRAKQKEHKLVLRVGDGPTAKERSIVLGDIIDFWYPNEMGVIGKFGRFLHNGWAFVSDVPREANTEGGIFPAIFGTFVMTLLMSAAVTPVGVLAAIYLREYAKQGPLVRAVRIAINNLAGVPSIVFGVFGLGFFVYFVGGSIDSLLFSTRLPSPTFGTGGLIWCALTLALMTVPVVIVATEEAIAAIPRGAREASLALGSSRWQTIQRIILPASVPGILTGLILAMARGAGEVAPLMLVGVVKLAPSLPIDGAWNDTDVVPFVHLDQKFMHLGFHIYDLGFQSPDSEAAKPMVFATTLFLILLVVVLNLAAILLRERIRRRMATSTF